MSFSNFVNSLFDGRFPKTTKYEDSKKVAFSARLSIEWPLYLNIPFSPSKYVIALLHEPVFLNPHLGY